MPPPSRSHGRIHPSNCTTDNAPLVPIVGGIQEDHEAAIFTTNNQGMKDTVRSNYRSCNCKYMDFIHREYGESYDQLTVVLSEADKSNPRKYYYAKDERDLVYRGLDPAIFLAFVTEAKFVKGKDGSQKLASFSHMSKYYSAIKWSSTSCGSLLHTKFYADVDAFINYKKEFAAAKAAGNTEEKEADAICSTLFKLLMTWAVEQGNIFVWRFSLLIWHLMARSINIDCILLHSIKKGVSDLIVFKYDNTKMDQTGEFVQEKNCSYSNPLPGSEHLHLFTALGCYLSINSDSLTPTEKLFIKAGSQLRTASANFGRQMSKLANKSCNVVKNFVRLTHFSVHGFRKGNSRFLCNYAPSSLHIYCCPWRMEHGQGS
jgi:hypothetical protein